MKDMIDPHAAAPDEDPEDCIGDLIPDPWDDDKQLDWVSKPIEDVQLPDSGFGWFMDGAAR